MTTTHLPYGASANGSGQPIPAGTLPRPRATGERLPIARRPRRPLPIAFAAAFLLACAAGGAAVVTGGDGSVRVLTLARPVTAGHVFTAEDLGVARLSGSGLHALAAASAGRVVGQVAASSLPAGTLLTGAMLSSTPPPAAGMQIVAVSLKPGSVPVEVQAGRAVSVIAVPPGGTAATPATAAQQVLVDRAQVLSVRTDASSATTLVSLQVAAEQAAAVARAGAAGAVALTLLPVGP